MELGELKIIVDKALERVSPKTKVYIDVEARTKIIE